MGVETKRRAGERGGREENPCRPEFLLCSGPTDMGGLLVNTIPAKSVFSQCLLKASNRKHDQFQEVKQ